MDQLTPLKNTFKQYIAYPICNNLTTLSGPYILTNLWPKLQFWDSYLTVFLLTKEIDIINLAVNDF